jgi:hypothetical protein
VGIAGLITDPVSLPVLRDGIETLAQMIQVSAIPGPPVIAIEATGALHRAWVVELERRSPGSVRLFAPSQTQAARSQLGSRRVKTDDRDCAALVWLARQGQGRPAVDRGTEPLLAAVRYRHGPVTERKALQQRLHDQRNTLCRGLSAPAGHGRALPIQSATGHAVMACAAAFAGRPPTLRALHARTPGRMTQTTARFWIDRWRRCLPLPADAQLRAHRLARDLDRYHGLQADITDVQTQITTLLARTPAQILTTPDHAPRRRRDPRGRVRRTEPAHHPVPDRRAPVRRDRAGARDVAVRHPDPTRADLPPRPGRAPRRADEHRLGAVPALRQLP